MNTDITRTPARNRRLPLLLLLLATVSLPGAWFPAAAAQDPANHQDRALAVGSFGSVLAARLDADGTLDSGAGVLVLEDGATGLSLVPAALPDFGELPLLWASYATELGGLPASVRICGPTHGRNGDLRLRALTEVLISNPGDEVRRVVLQARVLAGSRPAAERPRPSPPLTPETRFHLEGELILRDGHLLATWSGAQPELTVYPAPEGPQGEVARLVWTFEVAARSSVGVEITLAGWPSTDMVDEAALRPAMLRQSFRLAQEPLDWSAGYVARFKAFRPTHVGLQRVMKGAVWQLRLMGQAEQQVVSLSDRPWGHPATDLAVQAEQIAAFAEWGFGGWAFDYVNKLPERALAEGPALPPERRLQLAYGLVRGGRLVETLEVDPALRTSALGRIAEVVTALVTEPAAVAPWQDPAVVTADLTALYTELGLDVASLPPLSWAEVPPGGLAAALQAARKAVSARDGLAFWSILKPWVEAASPEGLLPPDPHGLSAAAAAVGLLSVMREALIDDHGPQLVLWPTLHEELIPGDGPVQIPQLPTRFGTVILDTWYGGGRRGRIGFKFSPRLDPAVETVLVVPPAGRVPRDVTVVTTGQVVLRPDGLLEVTLDKGKPTSWELRLQPEPGP